MTDHQGNTMSLCYAWKKHTKIQKKRSMSCPRTKSSLLTYPWFSKTDLLWFLRAPSRSSRRILSLLLLEQCPVLSESCDDCFWIFMQSTDGFVDWCFVKSSTTSFVLMFESTSSGKLTRLGSFLTCTNSQRKKTHCCVCVCGNHQVRKRSKSFRRFLGFGQLSLPEAS